MLFAKIAAGAVVEYPVPEFAIRQAMPNVSFSAQFAPIDPYVEVTGDEPQVNWDQKVVEGTPTLINGTWTRALSVIECSAAEKAVLLAAAKDQKLAQLAATRSQKELGGTTFNGMTLATDVVSQTKYVGALLGAQIDPTSKLKWKMNDGSFVVLDAQAITAVAMAVRAHVQACFDNEAALRDLIVACTTADEVTLVDLTAGWPT